MILSIEIIIRLYLFLQTFRNDKELPARYKKNNKKFRANYIYKDYNMRSKLQTFLWKENWSGMFWLSECPGQHILNLTQQYFLGCSTNLCASAQGIWTKCLVKCNEYTFVWSQNIEIHYKDNKKFSLFRIIHNNSYQLASINF